ncbi:MAG TPA: TonB-dependent receptor [Vicinamibacterales bacterium]|nr:TonB-dependent receptor [Vicinamibacterales bacterium]
MRPIVRRLTIATLSCAFVCLLPISAHAFEGRAIDRLTGRPIAGATIAIAGLAGTVTTDADGRFTWTPDPPLPFDVLVILPGGGLAKPVRILARDPTAPLAISVDPVLAETLVISGAAPSVDAPLATATTLVSSLDIGRRAPANLVQALENVAGVGAVAEGQSAVPAIRGLARGRTLFLLDGSRLFSERRAGPSVTFLAPESLDRIDVARGPASVAFGSDAFGGVISSLTPQPSLGAPFHARLTGTFGAGVPSQRVDGEAATGLGARAGILVAAHGRTADDYSSPDGVVANSAWRDSGALVRAGVTAGGWWTIGWQGDFARDTGLPRSDSATLLVTMPFERSKRTSVSFDRAAVPGLGHVNVRGLYGNYEQRLDQDRLPAPGRPRRIDRSDIAGTDTEIRAVFRPAVHLVRLSTGVDLVARHDLHAHDIGIAFDAAGAVVSTTDNASIDSAHKRDVGAFAQVDVPIGGRVTATAGARADYVRSVNEGGFFGDRTVSHSAASGSAAIAVRAWSSLTMTAQVSRGFRDPTLSDRFFRGPVGRGFIIGNPDLLPERSLQIDAGARYDVDRWRIGASYYHYDISDLIERYQAGPETFLFRNRGLAQIRGVEVEGRLDASRGFSIEASAQTGRGRAKDDDAALDDIAAPKAILQLRQAIGNSVFVSARVAAFARDDQPGPTEVATPGYVDVSANATWRTGRWVELRVEASNLLNERYYSSASSRGVLAAGRAAMFTAVLRY